MTDLKHYHIDLANLDLNTLDAYESFQFNEHICYHNKIEALELIVEDVNGRFEYLSLNLKDIVEQYKN